MSDNTTPTNVLALHAPRGNWQADRTKLVTLLNDRTPFVNTTRSLRGWQHVPGRVLPFTGQLADRLIPLVTTESDYVVFSYSTPIAWHVPANTATGRGVWYVPEIRYSATTSRHQQTISLALDGYPTANPEPNVIIVPV